MADVMRIQRALARAGVASRRGAEELVAAGRVRVNGQVARTGQSVDPDADEITVDGKLLSAPKGYFWIVLNKPPGVLTTKSDPQGRVTRIVHHDLPGEIDGMDAQLAQFPVAAFKTYTQFGPRVGPAGFFLDDDQFGTPFIERSRKLGVRRIAVHKGLPFGQRGYQYSVAHDIGPVARRHPDMTFLIYHAGFDPSVREGPYDAHAKAGVDALVRSMQEAGNPTNVYAELGSTWRFLMRDPDQDYFVEGIHEALITDLSRISTLKVTSRTSVMRYKGARKPLPEIACELSVDAVMASIISCDPRIAAGTGFDPFSRYVKMFSRMTMELSTSIPTPSERPAQYTGKARPIERRATS